jgi:transketolase
MEGVASEAASLAGHLGLAKLVVVYDDNHITIDGDTDRTFNEDVGRRFEAYGWRVLAVDDGNDLEAIDRAFAEAAAPGDRPTLIRLRTIIGYPAPTRQNTAKAHGEPLGKDEVAKTKEILGWPAGVDFHIPDDVAAERSAITARGDAQRAEWTAGLERYRAEHPDLARELDDALSGRLALDWDALLPRFPAGTALATRQASGSVLQTLVSALPTLAGGSADLAGSTGTSLKGLSLFRAGEPGRDIAWGIREHAMGSAMNGMALHGGIRPYGATFLVFADYMKPAIRLAALMKLPVLYIFTHDSVGLGEDGPTHQPIEHLAMLRSIPGMLVLRPGDAAETAEAWRAALEHRDGPTALVLTRQKLPTPDRAALGDVSGVRRGGYVVREPSRPAEAILIASGSELPVALDAAARLDAEGIPVRVVSLPSWELFRRQPDEYRSSVLPPALRARVSIEAATRFGWLEWVTEAGTSLAIDHFGASAPGDRLLKEFGFTPEAAVAAVRRVLGRSA